MQLFFSQSFTESVVKLDNQESRHCAKVLRKKAGDEIQVVDGKGNLYTGRLIEVGVKECRAEIINTQHNFGKRDFNLILAIAPTKNISRFEWFLEKATEIGADAIVPIITVRSERKKINLDRLNKILIIAMKQSGKAFLPELTDPVSFKEFVKSLAVKKNYSRYIATCAENLSQLKNAYKKGSDVTVLIGPEGDFSEDEVALALENGCLPISLGPDRLRVETAGIVACHTINFINQ